MKRGEEIKQLPPPMPERGPGRPCQGHINGVSTEIHSAQSGPTLGDELSISSR